MLSFFQHAFTNIDSRVIAYAAEKSQAVALMIEPAVTTGVAVHFAAHGTQHMLGQVEEPFVAFMQKTLKIVLVMAVALNLGEYNAYVIQTFQDSPVMLAAALSDTTATTSAAATAPNSCGAPVVGSTLSGNMGTVLDCTLEHVNNITEKFFSPPQWYDIEFYVLGAIVFAVGLAVTIGTAALILLSKVATGLLLAVGPLAIAGLLFEWSKNYFTSFVNLLIQYGLVGALAVGANSFILSMFDQSATTLAGLDLTGAGLTAGLNDVAGLLVSGGLGIIVMWQVPSIAAGIAGGVSLSTFGLGRKVAGGAWNKATDKRGRDNQRSAVDHLDVNRRKGIIEKRAKDKEDKLRPRAEIRKTGTEG
jgi:type IV secretion system protein VirB6